jgi:hypothetical protein
VASHHQRTADILPFGQPRDHVEGARYIRPHDLARINGEPVDIYASFQPDEPKYKHRFLIIGAIAVLLWLAIFAAVAILSFNGV